MPTPSFNQYDFVASSRPQLNLNLDNESSSAKQAKNALVNRGYALQNLQQRTDALKLAAIQSHTGGSVSSASPVYTPKMREEFIEKKQKEIHTQQQQLQHQINTLKSANLESLQKKMNKMDELAKETPFKSPQKNGLLKRAVKGWRSVGSFFSRGFNFSGKLFPRS